jgi:ribosomal 30S subunit maturation factor RimM
MQEDIEVGYQVFTADGGEEVGAVRRVLRDGRGLVVYIENTGDCEIPSDAIAAVHSQKVVLKWDKLSSELKDAIRHAHDAELPDGEDADK